jgi:hypothetical protein
MSAITTMQAVELIQDHMKKIEPFRIVFAFKKMRLKPIRTTTVELMTACIAAHDYGLPITPTLIKAIFGGKTDKSTGLHTLGDKRCLLLKRSDQKGHMLEWAIDPLFLRNYK